MARSIKSVLHPHTRQASLISTILRSTSLAVACGNRIMTSPALLSWEAVSGRVTFTRWPFTLLHRPWVMNLLCVSAMGEIVADKMPFTPARTEPGPLLVRVLSGAGVAAAQFSADGRSPWIGGTVGAAVAGAQTFAGYTVRMRLNQRFPNTLSGIVGDTTTLACALGAVAPRKRRWIW